MLEYTRKFTHILGTRLSEKLNFIQVIVGPRQVGKTTGVMQIYEKWNGAKVMGSADLPAPPDSEWIISHWNRAKAQSGPVLLVLDEIQKIPRWSETIKGLFDRDRDERRLKVVLLGSASLPLATGLNETLAGRFEKIDVPHWDYAESKAAFGGSLETFLTFGGYPAAMELSAEPLRWQQFIRDSIIEPALSRDIFGLASIRKPALFRQTFELAMHFPAQEVSYQKLVGQLQDPGNLSTIRHYLEILESAFFIKLITKYSPSIVREKRTSPKILPLCPALVHGFVGPTRMQLDSTWRGHVIELAVGARLLHLYKQVFYWRKHNVEVDFVVKDGSILYAVEVKASHERKRSGLSRFLKEFPHAIACMITDENIEQFLLGGTLEQVR